MKDNEYILRIVLKARDETASALAGVREELVELQRHVKDRDSDFGKLSNTMRDLNTRLLTGTKRLREFRGELEKIGAGAKDSDSNIDRMSESIGRATKNQAEFSKSVNRSTKETDRAAKSTQNLGREINDTDGRSQVLAKTFLNMATNLGEANGSLSKLAGSMRGLVVVTVLTFAQSLTSVIVGLGGAAVGLASSLGYAAIALGGTFTAAVAQATPVVAGLIAAFQRVGSVMDAVKAQNEQQKYASQDAAAASEQQAAAQDQVASASRSLADAHRAVQSAQEGLTQARKEATDQLEDMALAESASDLSLRGARLSLQRARENLATLDPGASALDRKEAQLSIDEARQRIKEAKLTASRADEDLAHGRRVGVGGLDPMVAAREELASAERNATDASRALQSAQEGVASATSEASARVEKLERELAGLSGAERDLYEAFLSIQNTYQDLFRPLSDTIIDSFAEATGEVEDMMKDPQLLSAFEGMAEGIAGQVDQTFDMFTGPRREQIIGFVEDSTKNMDLFGDSTRNLIKWFMNLAEAANPALRRLLKDIEDLTAGWVDATQGKNADGLEDFFVEGIRHLEKWATLLGEIIGLFGDLAREGGADAGAGSVREFTNEIRRARKSIEENKESVREFFEDSQHVFERVRDVLYALGDAMINIFQEQGKESVDALADFLIEVFIPALEFVIIHVGKIVEGILELGTAAGPVVQIIIGISLAVKLISTAFRLFIGPIATIARLVLGVEALNNRFTLLRAGQISVFEAVTLSTGAINKQIVAWNAVTVAAERAAVAQRTAAMAATPLGVRGGPVVTTTSSSAYRGVASSTPRPVGPTSVAPTTVAATATRGVGAASMAAMGGPLGIAMLGLFAAPFIAGAIGNIKSFNEELVELREKSRASGSKMVELAESVSGTKDALKTGGQEASDLRDQLKKLDKGTQAYKTTRQELNDVVKRNIELEQKLREEREDLKGQREDTNLDFSNEHTRIEEELTRAKQERQADILSLKDAQARVDAGFADPEDMENYIVAVEESSNKVKELRGELRETDSTWMGYDISFQRAMKGEVELIDKQVKAVGRLAGKWDDFPKKLLIETNNPDVLKKLSHLADKTENVVGKKRVMKILGDSDSARQAIEKLERITDKKTEDMARKSNRRSKDVQDGWAAAWGASTKSAENEGNKSEKATDKSFTGIFNIVEDSMKGVWNVIKTRMSDSTEEGIEQSDRLAKGVITNIGDIQGATYTGMGYIGQSVNKALGAYGVDKLDLSIPRPKNLRGERAAGGPGVYGYVGGKGRREEDEHLIAVGGGEGIFNHYQMPYVDSALKKTYGYGADELWRRQRNRHSGLPGQSVGRAYAEGGIVPVPGFPGESAASSILDEIKWVIKNFPGLVLTDAFGPGHSSPGHTVHGTAADFSGPDDAMNAAVRALVSKGYLVGYDGSFGSEAWAGHGPSTVTPNYHLHVEFGGTGAGLSGGVKTGMGIGREVLDKLKVRGLKSGGRDLVQGAMDRTVKGAQKYLDKKRPDPAQHGALNFDSVAVGPLQDMAKEMIMQTWGAGQWPYFKELVNRESTWNPKAVNPSSGAAGLAQALPPSKYPDGAWPYTGPESAKLQLEWMINYIRTGNFGAQSYSTPAGALEFHDANNWYSRGGSPNWGGWHAQGMDGVVTRPTLFGAGEAGPERVTVEPMTFGPPEKGITANQFRRMLDEWRKASKNDKEELLDGIHEKMGKIKVSNIDDVIDYTRRAKARLIRQEASGSDVDAMTEILQALKEQQAFNRIEGRQSDYKKIFGADGAETRVEIDKAQYQMKAKGGDDAFGKNLNKVLGLFSKLTEQMSKYLEDLQYNLTDATYRIRRIHGELVASMALSPRQVAAKQLDIAQKALEQQRTLIREQEQTQKIVNNKIKGLRRDLKNADDKEAKQIEKELQNLKKQREGIRDSIHESRNAMADREAELYEAQLALEQFRVDKINERADRRLAAADRASRIQSATGDSTGAGFSMAQAQIDVAEQQMADLRKALRKAKKLGDRDLINSIQDQMAELGVVIAEATESLFDMAVDAINAEADKGLNFSNTMVQILQSIANITGKDTTAAQLDWLNKNSGILQTQGQGLKDMLAKAVAAGDQDAIDDLKQAILDNYLAQLQNTEAINELNGTMNMQNYSSASWEMFRQAIFDGNGNLLPQFSNPSAGNPSSAYNNPSFSGGGGSSNSQTNIDVDVNMVRESADPQEIGQRIAWEAGLK